MKKKKQEKLEKQEKKLFPARLIDLSRAYLPELGNYKWTKYLILMWALRMSFFVVSLLFPIIASFGSPQETDIYQQQLLNVDIKDSEIEELLSKRIPFVINDFSRPRHGGGTAEDEGGTIGQILDMELSRILTNVKVSQNLEFTHFSPDQSWSVLFSQFRTYSLVNMDVSEFFQHRSNLLDETYVYLSRQIRDPPTSIILQTLAPNLMSLPMNKGVVPDVRLWMSSKGVIASPHYDMEHNFFLQVNGTKKFILASPIHYEVFHPYSYLHPCWRQSQHLHLLNVTAIRSSPSFSEKKRRKMKPRTSSSSPSSSSSSSNSEYCSEDDDSSQLSSTVHEVVLTPGQLLYIPPFYYHSVTALDEYSVSINAWVGSSYVQAADKLRLQSPLPYHSSGDIEVKLSSLGNLIKTVLMRLALPYSLEEIKRNLLSRADLSSLEIELTKLEEECSSIYPFSLCTEEVVRVAGYGNKVRQSAEKIFGSLGQFPPSIQRVLLLDYFEEILDSLISPNSSPQSVVCFVSRCMPM